MFSEKPSVYDCTRWQLSTQQQEKQQEKLQEKQQEKLPATLITSNVRG